MSNVAAKHTTKCALGIAVGSDALQSVLPLHHFLVLLLKNCVELLALQFVLLGLRHVGLYLASPGFNRQAFAIIIEVVDFGLIVHGKLATLIEVTLGNMTHALSLGEPVHVDFLALFLLKVLEEFVVALVVNVVFFHVAFGHVFLVGEIGLELLPDLRVVLPYLGGDLCLLGVVVAGVLTLRRDFLGGSASFLLEQLDIVCQQLVSMRRHTQRHDQVVLSVAYHKLNLNFHLNLN